MVAEDREHAVLRFQLSEFGSDRLGFDEVSAPYTLDDVITEQADDIGPLLVGACDDLPEVLDAVERRADVQIGEHRHGEYAAAE